MKFCFYFKDIENFPYLCLNYFKKYLTEFFPKMSQKIQFPTLVHKIKQKSKNHIDVRINWDFLQCAQIVKLIGSKYACA